MTMVLSYTYLNEITVQHKRNTTTYHFYETKEDYLKALNIAMFGDIEIDDDLLMIKMQNENRFTMNYDERIEAYNQKNRYTLIQ